jgi:hypothetical protein
MTHMGRADWLVSSLHCCSDCRTDLLHLRQLDRSLLVPTKPACARTLSSSEKDYGCCCAGMGGLVWYGMVWSDIVGSGLTCAQPQTLNNCVAYLTSRRVASSAPTTTLGTLFE